jgi:AcrR family transcriptional regulator
MSIREKILDAAVKVYGEYGFRGATTRRIADAAGVNEVSIFRTFGCKAALIDQAVRAHAGPGSDIRLPVAPVDPLTELTEWANAHYIHLGRMRAIIRQGMSDLEEHPEMAAVCKGPEVAGRELHTYATALAEGNLIDRDADIVVASTMYVFALFADAMGRGVLRANFPQPASAAAEQYTRVYLKSLGFRGKIPAPSTKRANGNGRAARHSNS